MISITADRQKKTGRVRLWAVVLWLALWQAGTLALGQEILLVSPVAVLKRLAELALTGEFWYSIVFSMARIMGGFLLGAAGGVLLAGLGARFERVREFLSPAVLAVKAVPVASFVILALIWVSSGNLSILVSFLMVFPVIYTNVLEGVQSVDRELLEMAGVFEIPGTRKIRYIYVSQVLPFFCSGCRVALGLCWKAGVAAEVIGIPDGSIGEKLYKAKVYLDTPDLFAWTVVIVIISLIFERVFLGAISWGVRRLERG